MAEPQHPPPPAEAPAAPSPPSSAAENASPAPDKEDPPAQPTLTEQTPPPPLDPLPSDEPPEIPEKEEQQPPETEPEKTLTLEKEPEQVTAESRSLAAMMEKEELPPPQQEVSEKTVAVNADEEVSGDVKDKSKAPQSLVSFKEESNNVADLSEFEKKALLEFKQLVQEALNTRQFSSPPPPKESTMATEPKTEAVSSAESDASTTINPPQEPAVPENPQEKSEEEVKLETHSPEEFSIWGIPLLKDDRSDVILLKFLRARDFKPKDAFIMIKNTIQWRKDFGIEELVDEDLGDDLDKVVFMHGHDKDGHPVCYNVYGEFQNKELYQKTFSDEEKRMEFLRWRIQFLERSIRKLDFSPGGVCTIFQVNDLKNSPGPGKRELRLATKQALHILQDNYPEFVAKQVFINVPWWYLAFYTMISPFMTQRTKSKFIFAGPSKSAEALFKYILPEQVPIQYGGLSVDYCDCNPEFTIADPVTEVIIKPAIKQTVEIIIYEKCVLVWEARVVGWEVSYGAEFVPDAKDGYTVIIQKPTKMTPMDDPVVCQSFEVSELGKVLLTIDNPTSKKKKLLYRFKVKPFSN